MIDDFRTIELLMEKIRAALPMRAHVGRDVIRTLRQEAPEAALSHQGIVTEVRYAGDEGGILCTLAFRRRCIEDGVHRFHHPRDVRAPEPAVARHRALQEAPHQTIAATSGRCGLNG